MWTLQVLGPVQLQQDSVAVPLATHKAQALLTLLAVDGAQPRARLASFLWPTLDEASARRNLRRELARFREAGAADVLDAGHDTLALAASLRLDTHCFTADLQAGRPQAALTWWRAPLADGLQLNDAAPFEDWLAGARTRWAAQHRVALQGCAHAAEAGGDLVAALRHINTLLAEDPLQEHHHRDAMRLHAAAGHREAALAQYERCKALLAQELGLAPMEATQTLWLSVRDRTVTADLAPAAVPTALPAWTSGLPFVGRHTEWQQLSSGWRSGHTLLVEGVGGIGKTRLANDFAASRGAFASAQCRSEDAHVPYASFTRALRCLAGQTLANAALPAWVAAELARVLPELGSATQPIQSAEEQRRFFEGCAHAWQHLAEGNFDVVLIDDWHLADAASRKLLTFIAAQRREHQPQLAREIFVLRPELDADALDTLQNLAVGATHVRLQALDDSTVLELVRQLSGAADPQRFAARLQRATGGNPFSIAETLRHWQEQRVLALGADGVWQTPFDTDTEDYVELPVPHSVREAVLARVRRLPDAPQRLLQAAALAAEPFAPAMLAQACALSEVEALEAIDVSVQSQLLQERDGGGYAFAHDLVQHALAASLTPERRRLVHRRLALGAQAAQAPPAQIAAHWEAGGEPQRAVDHRIAAAEAAAALYSLEAAFPQWQAGLDDGASPAQRLRILRRRWPWQRALGQVQALQDSAEALLALRSQTLAQAAAVAQQAGVEAASIFSVTGRSLEALPIVDGLLAQGPHEVTLQARALEVRATSLSNLGRTLEAIHAADQALAIPQLELTQQARLLSAAFYAHYLRGEPMQALPYARGSLAVWQSLGNRSLAAKCQSNIGTLLLLAGDADGALVELEAAYAVAGELRLAAHQRDALMSILNIALTRGQAAHTLLLCDRYMALSANPVDEQHASFLLSFRSCAHYQLGQLGEALRIAEAAHTMALASGEPMCVADCVSMTLDLYTWTGDRAGAAHLLASLQGQPLDGIGHYSVKLGFNRILHALQVGDVTQARELFTGLGDAQALQQPDDRANAALCEAELLWAEGQPQQALAALQAWPQRLDHAEIWARMCSLRLAVYSAQAQPVGSVLVQADAALASGCTSAPMALQLLRRRQRAAELAGDEPRAAQCAEALSTQVQALAESLHGRTRQQQQFLALWR